MTFGLVNFKDISHTFSLCQKMQAVLLKRIRLRIFAGFSPCWRAALCGIYLAWKL